MKDPKGLMMVIADKSKPVSGGDMGDKSDMMYVPLAALQVDDGSGDNAGASAGDGSAALVAPAPGDKVSFTVEGTVQSVDGDTVCVDPDSINGQSVENDESPGEDAAEGDEGDSLRAQAQKEDQLY